MKKIKFIRTLKEDPLDHQMEDWGACVYMITEAVVQAHMKCWGLESEVPISEEVERAIEKDILERGIAVNKYDPVLKIYLEAKGYVYR